MSEIFINPLTLQTLHALTTVTLGLLTGSLTPLPPHPFHLKPPSHTKPRNRTLPLPLDPPHHLFVFYIPL